MKKRLMVVGIAIIAMLNAGCAIVPMTYAQWQQEQRNRINSQRAGLPYKSPAQLRSEAAEMREIADKVTFEPAAK